MKDRIPYCTGPTVTGHEQATNEGANNSPNLETQHESSENYCIPKHGKNNESDLLIFCY